MVIAQEYKHFFSSQRVSRHLLTVSMQKVPRTLDHKLLLLFPAGQVSSTQLCCWPSVSTEAQLPEVSLKQVANAGSIMSGAHASTQTVCMQTLNV